MSAEIERIKKLVQEDQLVAAVELPSQHKSRPIVSDDLDEVLSSFDEDANYAHFIVRVKRGKEPLPKIAATALEKPVAEVSIASMVNETLEFSEEISQNRELKSREAKTQTDLTLEYEPRFLIENALLLEENGDHELSRNIYQALIRKGLCMSQALAGTARTLEKQGRYEESIQNYREAIAYSSDVNYFQNLAALQIKLGKDEEACTTLIHAMGMPNLNDEQKFDFHKSLGNCYTRLSEYDRAEVHYGKAYDLQPNSDVLHVNVGSLGLQKGDSAAAETHFQKALEINPANDKAMSGLGLVYLAKNQLPQAYDSFLKSLKLNINNLGSIYNLVKCAYELRNFDDAASILKEYVAKNKVNANILYSYAGILFHQGDLASAKAEVVKILATNPNHLGACELKEILDAKEGANESGKV